jgi:DNA-binding protein HU-beta
MNKGDVVEMVAAELGEPKVVASRAVEAVFASIARGVEESGKVAISGFGTFRKKDRKARIGRNPATKQEIMIPASCTVSFTPSQALKDAMGTPQQADESCEDAGSSQVESKAVARERENAAVG